MGGVVALGLILMATAAWLTLERVVNPLPRAVIGVALAGLAALCVAARGALTGWHTWLGRRFVVNEYTVLYLVATLAVMSAVFLLAAAWGRRN